MRNELVFIVSTAVLLVLLVPFVSGQSIIPVACAVIRDSNYDTGSCTGSRWDKNGQTCCWREQVPGKVLADTYCQTCKNYKDGNGNTYEKCTDKTKQAIKLPQGETVAPQQGGILENPSNLEDSQEKTFSKRADILGQLDNNMTLFEANNTDND